MGSVNGIHPEGVVELCCAKLNLFLEVTGRREDGFHDLTTVFHEVGLADHLHVAPAPDLEPGEIVLDVTGYAAEGVPTGDRNLVVRALRLAMESAGSTAPLRVVLDKRIPSGGGLGGGSADAAGALRAVNRLLELDWPDDRLEELGLLIGSDIPFLVRGGTAVAHGRGEVLDTADGGPGMRFLLIVPRFGIATERVFAALPDERFGRREPQGVLAALAAADSDALVASSYNALLLPAEDVEPRLAVLRAHVEQALDEPALLTGSGSTLFIPLAGDDAAPVVPEHELIRTVLEVNSGDRRR